MTWKLLVYLSNQNWVINFGDSVTFIIAKLYLTCHDFFTYFYQRLRLQAPSNKVDSYPKARLRYGVTWADVICCCFHVKLIINNVLPLSLPRFSCHLDQFVLIWVRVSSYLVPTLSWGLTRSLKIKASLLITYHVTLVTVSLSPELLMDYTNPRTIN